MLFDQMESVVPYTTVLMTQYTTVHPLNMKNQGSLHYIEKCGIPHERHYYYYYIGKEYQEMVVHMDLCSETMLTLEKSIFIMKHFVISQNHHL